MDSIAANETVIAGLGLSGQSAARYLRANAVPFVAIDRALESASLPEELRDIVLIEEAKSQSAMSAAMQIVASPGLDLYGPMLQAAIRSGVPVIGDIELFSRRVRAPVLGVTGTNGKSSVTQLIGHIAAAAGFDARVGGNIGIPALDLLHEPRSADGALPIYCVELSSFQLDTTRALAPFVAVITNVSADHLDRHGTIERYVRAKARVLRHARHVVLNWEDSRVRALGSALERRLVRRGGSLRWVSLDRIDRDCYCVEEIDGESWFCFNATPIAPTRCLSVRGKHQQRNALAAIAATKMMGVSNTDVARGLTRFTGLADRCEFVARVGDVDYINDSKGTNLGATQAAIEGLASGKNIVLIAGGDAKGADLAPLTEQVGTFVHDVVLIGRDGPLLDAAIGGACATHRAESVEQAVTRASELAHAGDVVLLSPACASWDMFSSYVERGRAFRHAVAALESKGVLESEDCR